MGSTRCDGVNDMGCMHALHLLGIRQEFGGKKRLRAALVKHFQSLN